MKKINRELSATDKKDVGNILFENWINKAIADLLQHNFQWS